MSIRRHPSKAGFWQIIISQGAHGKQIVTTFRSYRDGGKSGNLTACS